MSTDTGVIWRGFHHAWRYNHRLNRLGSYLQRTDETDPGWKVVHTAASGTGPDTAQFCDLYTEVAAPDVTFEPTQQKVRLQGDEATTVVETTPVSVPIDDDLAGFDEYAVVLNGFDIVSEADADKLMSMTVSVSQPSAPSGGSLSFEASVSFEADCGTPECSGDGIDYTCYLFFLVIAGDQSGFRLGPTTSGSASYGWTLDREPDRKGSGVSRDSVPSGELWNASGVTRTVGVTGFSVDLVKTGEPDTTEAAVAIADLLQDQQLEAHRHAMHLLELDLSVESFASDASGFEAVYLTFFKNWEEGMKQLLPDDFLQSSDQFIPSQTQNALQGSGGLTIHDFIDASIWTHRNAGEATLDIEGRVLQFADPDTFDPNAVPGNIDWPGEGKDAKKFSDALYDTRTDTRRDDPGDSRHETLIV